MKRVLIISPYFPPINAADMQRVRMSLPYFREFGWEPEVVAVDIKYTDMSTDDLLNESIPDNVPIHCVKALSKKWTSKVGLGSVAIRSLFFFKKRVNQLLKDKKVDLIYFSTTQFPVCILGSYWKRKFGVPYVIDMQDPWVSDYYKNKPKAERPPKFWIANKLNELLEPIAMKKVDGLIAVSSGYLKTLSDRYENCKNISQQTIPFGAFQNDFAIARRNTSKQPSILPRNEEKINVVYIGRGGNDMHDAVSYLFETFKQLVKEQPEKFKRIHFYFIGTSYAAAGKGVKTILPVAQSFGIEENVTEITDRIPFYQTLNTLDDADALFVPGSNDPQYTASKIYPYVLANKPLLAIFHPSSSVVSFLKKCRVGTIATFDEEKSTTIGRMKQFFWDLCSDYMRVYQADESVLENYSARSMTEKQCEVFDDILQKERNLIREIF